jgi:NAD(P)H-quinone oxidoreductase subunit 5
MEIPMPSTLALLPLLAPLLLCAVAVLARLEPGQRPRRVLRASRAATVFTLALAGAAALAVAAYGASVSPLLGIGEVGLSVRLDALSAVMFALVAFVGAIVVQYSRNYLDGDSRHGAFIGSLCLTLAAVLLLVLSGNLFQLVAAWIATSLALQRLLLFHADRPRALIAARKKFIIARAGDACLILAAMLLAQAFGTTDIGAILIEARAALAADERALAVHLAAVCLAVAALLKSAQFPTHGWLPEVMEAPTPVSALLHAGIINAGGFLIVRFADVMLLSAPSMYLLGVIGGFTALFGSVVMLTQTSVKVSLAYSTVAQMGFMLLQCGLGAFPVAVLHIVAHSFYKAHAFLSSGSVVEIARASWIAHGGKQHPLQILVSLMSALAIFAGVGALLGVSLSDKPAVMALGAILVMGLTHLLAQALEGKPNGYVIGRTCMVATATALAYFLLEIGAERILASTLPITRQADAAMIALMVLAVGSFGLVTLLQLLAPSMARSPRWQAAYVHISNGFYVNAMFNRLVGALRHSPTTSS